MTMSRESSLGLLHTYWIQRPIRGQLLAVATALALTIGASFVASPVFKALDERAAGAVWRGSDPERIERRFVLIDIDEKSLKEVGPWPWPREKMAQLTRALDQQQVGLKLFDVVFPESKGGDQALVSAMGAKGSGPSVAAQIFSLDSSNTTQSGMLSGALPLSVCPPASAKGYGFLGNGMNLGKAGHITPRIDPDGAVRQVPALVCFEGKAYPSLVLAGLSEVAGADSKVELRPADSWFTPAWTLSFSGLPGVRVPLSDSGDMRVSYRLPRDAFISVSAADVLAGRVPENVLKQSWALVGATAFGLGDTVPTPLGGAVSGLEVHAQLLSAILDDRLPYTPGVAVALPWALGTVIAVLLLLLASQVPGRFSRARAVALPLVGIAFVVVAFVVHAILLVQLHWFVGISQLAFFVILASLGLAMVNHARARFETARVFEQFSSHVPAQVAEQLAFEDASDLVSAKRQELTVLFADIRNFSAFSEKRPSEEVARVLHEFFTVATRVIESHDGVVEHMVGDSIMAVWNGPKPCAQHAENAVRAAQVIWRECMAVLPDVSAHDLEPLDLGIGLETGLATIGIFGSQSRRTHTVLGESVTVAVQLQALTADLASPVLAGETLATRVRGDWKALGYFLLPGLTRSRRVYSLPVLSPAQQQERLKLLDLHRPSAA